MGARRDFPIDAGFAGGRLETFLRTGLGLPRTLALKAIRKGWIRVGGKRAKPELRLDAGVVVTVTNPALTLPAIEAPREAPKVDPALVAAARKSIRSSDDAVIVSAKPAGEVVHAGTGHAAGWVDALKAATGGDAVPIGRLDRDTSGLLLCARNRAATRVLFDSLKEGRVARTYSCVVLGEPRDEGMIDTPLEKLPGEMGEQVKSSETGKPAVTRFKVVERLRGAALLSVEIETGRTHQIRAHMASIDHPLLGDPRQRGLAGAALEVTRRAGLGRLFLHAGELRFPHPSDGKERRFEEPLPQDLARALDALR